MDMVERDVGTDGVWVRLNGGTKRVALLVVDNVTGVIWPSVVAPGEESEIGEAAAQAASGLKGAAAKSAQKRVRRELSTLIHHVLDAASYPEAEEARNRRIVPDLVHTRGKMRAPLRKTSFPLG